MSAKSKPHLPLWIALVAAACAIAILSLIDAFLKGAVGWIATAAVVVALIIVLRRISFRGVAVEQGPSRKRNRDMSNQ